MSVWRPLLRRARHITTTREGGGIPAKVTLEGPAHCNYRPCKNPDYHLVVKVEYGVPLLQGVFACKSCLSQKALQQRHHEHIHVRPTHKNGNADLENLEATRLQSHYTSLLSA